MQSTTPQAVCGAKKRDGSPCPTRPMPNGKCRMHGGKSLTGIASPTFVSGTRSSNLPARMMADYEQSKNDPDALAVRSELALTDARINDLLARVDTGEAGEVWRSLRQTYAIAMDAQSDMNAAPREGKDFLEAKQTYEQAIETIGTLIAEGAQDYLAWDEVHKMIEQRRKLAETEIKRGVQMQKTLDMKQTGALVGALAGIVRKHVTDRAALTAISADITALVAS